MGSVIFGMSGRQMHIFVHLLDAKHIGFGVISQLYFLSSADAFGAPVEIAQIDGNSRFLGDEMESRFPAGDRFARSFRREREVESLVFFHLDNSR